jgi:2'-5' RNA ligase
MPRGEVQARLSQIVRRLSARHGAPQFPPHVTLLGNLAGPPRELISASAQLASSIRSLAIRLEQVDVLDEYFRCLFARVALTSPLRNTYQAACRAMGVKRPPVFMPHLSLLYGNFPQSLKHEIIAEIGPRFDLQFKVRSLHLYQTRGDPLEWRPVATFGLK